MNQDFANGLGSDFDHKTTGRWSREEHEKFIEGIKSKDIISKLNKFLSYISYIFEY